MTKKKVLVLCGGDSSEREVSLMSGRNVYENIPRDKYQVLLVEIAESGDWYEIVNSRKSLIRNIKQHISAFDVVFIALHGGDGENGKIQSFLRSTGVRYTGSDVAASQLAIDKHRTSEMVKKLGVIIPKTIMLLKGSKIAYQEIGKEIGYPCIVKPNSAGSSIATNIVHKSADIKKAIEDSFKEDCMTLVQQYIKGRELTCPVIGNHNGQLTALPVLEITHNAKIFDYRAKYKSRKTQEQAPIDLNQKIVNEVERQSIAIHTTLGCDGLTRSDFILGNDGELYFLEINTVPGMTKASLCPKSAKLAGIEFGQLIDQMIRLSKI